MKLQTTIQKRMIIVAVTTLILAYVVATFAVYNQTERLTEGELKQEAAYIGEAISVAGDVYLHKMDDVQKETRVTLIDTEGNVLYDSIQEDRTLENHRERKEFKDAVKHGEGKDIRLSNSTRKRMMYYAKRMDDGSVLRVAKTMDSVRSSALGSLVGMFGIAILMMVLVIHLSKLQVNKMIQPLYHLDLEHPLQNEVYEELQPLLEQIDEQNKQKEAMAGMRKEFTANVSHELKTPLTSISGYAEIMKNGMVKPEDMPVFSERIYAEATRLIKLVEDIINLSRLDEQKVEVDTETVDLYDLTREICQRLAPQCEKKHIHMEISGEHVKYEGVRRVLDEMIYNICENSVKYNYDNGSVKIWTGNTPKGPKLVVTDTGIGIPSEDKERVFERFYRVDKSHSKATGGTGLGLSIVKHGAMLHNIKIEVHSELEKGTKIELFF